MTGRVERHVLGLLADEFRRAMTLTGCAKTGDIDARVLF